MPEKNYFAYIRVSTARQGQTGTSLIEQRSAIARYSERLNLKICQEFEERETAARQGRPVFLEMIKNLKKGRANGVIMHKIDRSARNLKDWAELGELIDKGIEVLFANENLDLYSRGGRLSADIQAVVAADYIRNLKEEVKKGFYGRLKQGFYPMPAPLGYFDRGAGEAKEIDAHTAPLVKKMFELYATGNYGLRSLMRRMKNMGLKTKHGREVTIGGISTILHNPFYTGVIQLKISGEMYPGKHLPIISRKLFEKVQEVLTGKMTSQTSKKNLEDIFLFRKLATCDLCKYRLIGERQKGYLYYRCHTKTCAQKTIREELLDRSFRSLLQSIQFNSEEMAEAEKWFRHRHRRMEGYIEQTRKALTLQLEQTRCRLSKLTDALVDGIIEQELFIQKKNSLIVAQQELQNKLTNIEGNEAEALQKTEKFLEQVNSAYLSYKDANFEKKRLMVKTVTSNFFIREKNVLIKPHLPFDLLINRNSVWNGGPHRDRPRTLEKLYKKLFGYFLYEANSKDAEEELPLAP